MRMLTDVLDECRKECERLQDENAILQQKCTEAFDEAVLREAELQRLRSLEKTVRGIWQAFPGIRYDMGNTNYAVVQDQLCEISTVTNKT